LPTGAGFERTDEMKGPARRYNPQAPTHAEVDIMKEKAETLGRTGAKLEESLHRLRGLQERISILEKQGKGAPEVNDLITEFNEVREKAL
jgi:hypothetical protein